MTKIFVSPSSQEANVVGSYVEETAMNMIADILCPELTRHGIEWMRNSRGDTYKGHIEKSNLYKPDYHVAIHSNATGRESNTNIRGTEVYCAHPETSTSLGTQLARKVYRKLSELTPVIDRGILSAVGKLSEVMYTKAPAILMEVDFHDNAEGAEWIMNNIEPIAHAILLGILEQIGVAYIEPPKPVQSGIIYRVQIGAFSILTNAENYLDRIKLAGFPAFIKKDGQWYRIQVGAFTVRANADRYMEQVKRAGFDCFIAKT